MNRFFVRLSFVTLPLMLILALTLGLQVVNATSPTQTPPPQPDRETRLAEIDAIWTTASAEVKAKIDPLILAELRGESLPAHLRATSEIGEFPSHTRFLVYLNEEADLEAATAEFETDPLVRREMVVSSLRSTAQRSQMGLRRELSQRSGRNVLSYQPFFIVNAVAVDGDLDTLLSLASRSDVARIVANYPLIPLWDREEPSTSIQSGEAANVLANLERVGAPRVWDELEIRGEGAVLAGFDTGVNFTHPGLLSKYRGYVSENLWHHSYNWFEPSAVLYPSGDLGPSITNVPRDCDFGSHGTHTMGTMVGSEEDEATWVGMAPDAHWIAVPGICGNTMNGIMDGDTIGGLKAFQWLLCPTALNGRLETADCSMAPDAINNSWGSANPVDQTFRPVMRTLRSAGIAVVFASGNPEAGPGSVGSPGGAPEAITVGATNDFDQPSPFSGQGPSFYTGEIKPELSAPGESIISTVAPADYERKSGTSMSAPHVTGLIGLMVSADQRDGFRDLSVDDIETFLIRTAEDLGLPGPDGQFGYGRIDAYRAVDWVLSSGDLRGNVRDALTLDGVAHASVIGQSRTRDEGFVGLSDGAGHYTLTVPADLYDIDVGAWGYLTRTFLGQRVVPGTLSLLNFSLDPQPRFEVRGRVNAEGVRIYVEANPTVSVVSDSQGEWTLSLPTGDHDLIFEATGFRRSRLRLTAEVEIVHEVVLTPAPTILLVDTTAADGWFAGWPIYPFFEWALQESDLLYDLWRIEDSTISDSIVGIDGHLRYGVPSVATLSNYDLVIWGHSGCAIFSDFCSGNGFPASVGADDELIGFLDRGGRLILSGQDISTVDENSRLFDEYLQVDQTTHNAGDSGVEVLGRDFLEGIDLTITNGALYGYANGFYQLSPDSVEPQRDGGLAYPVLTYANGLGAAGMAVAPCDADYRAIYLAVGYENVAPRPPQIRPEMAELIGRSVMWLSEPLPTHNFSFFGKGFVKQGEVGRRVEHQFRVSNTGTESLALALELGGNRWPAYLVYEGREVDRIVLEPCQSAEISLQMQLPDSAGLTDEDRIELTISAPDHPGIPIHRSEYVAVVLPRWQEHEPTDEARFKQGILGVPQRSSVHILGGLRNNNGGDESISAGHEEFDVCDGIWIARAPLPEPLYSMAVGRVGEQVLIAGGWNDTDSPTSVTAAAYLYSSEFDRWRRVADLPLALGGASAVTLNGFVYLFGGEGVEGPSSRVFRYEPVSDTWSELSPIPNGGRSQMAAVGLGDLIYLYGGNTFRPELLIYNTKNDSWHEGTQGNFTRMGGSLVAGPDDRLYLLGGTGASFEAGLERYDPDTQQWSIIGQVDDVVLGDGVATFVSGRIVGTGGFSARRSTRSLRLGPGFCDSNLATSRSVVRPSDRVTYTLSLMPDRFNMAAASVRAPMPADSTFVAFVEASASLRYDPVDNVVEWQGSLEMSADPLHFSWIVSVDEDAWQSGDVFQSIASFDSGTGSRFTKSSAVGVFLPDLTPSRKMADREQVRSGERVTYTIELRSATPGNVDLNLRDQLPAPLRMVESTLQTPAGAVEYDSATRTLSWSGRLRSEDEAYFNGTEQYTWGDTNLDGELPGVAFEWVDIAKDGERLEERNLSGVFFECDLPIGFSFPYFGNQQTTFCVDSNGVITFGNVPAGFELLECALGGAPPGEPFIAVLWDDALVRSGIRYLTLGETPNRRLIVQWNASFPLNNVDGSGLRGRDFQAILYENGRIDFNYRDAASDNGRNSTVALLGADRARRSVYACDRGDWLNNETTVRWIPPGGTANEPYGEIRYATVVDAGVEANEIITNTVEIEARGTNHIRQTGVRVNPYDLSTSFKRALQEQIIVGESAGFRIDLVNRGTYTATDILLSDPIPVELDYVADSLSCSTGTCDAENDELQWEGSLAPGAGVTLLYSVTLSGPLPDGTVITNRATVAVGTRSPLVLEDTVLARRSDLGRSFVEIEPAWMVPGIVATTTLFLHNSGAESTDARVVWNLGSEPDIASDNITCGVGDCTLDERNVSWQVRVPPRSLVPLQVRMTIPDDASQGERFPMEIAMLDARWQTEHTLNPVLVVAHRIYLHSLMNRHEPPDALFMPQIVR